MWKASAGRQVDNTLEATGDDDWDTDPDFINDVSEQEQRWGSKTIEGSGRTAGTINMKELRLETEQSDANKKKKQIEESNPGYGYGGKFGLEADRMDKSALGHDYIGKVEKHASQKDYSDGFGGKFGVQTDRVDKSAVNWDHKEKVVKHSSQKDYSDGFGGKYGVQTDRIDKSAHGWDYVEKVEKHESQKDYSKGFGGKFGVQEDRKDASALGWDHIESVEKHESQTDHKKGFGGKFGVQSDRMDKSAIGFQSQPEKVGTAYTKVKPDIGTAKPSNLRAKFENLAKTSDEDGKQRAAEQKKIREEKDKRDKEEASKKQVFGEENVSKTVQRKGAISTGREGGIGNAISAFNQPQEVAPQRKDPIQLPKKDATPKIQPPPDLIPQSETAVEPPTAFRTSTSSYHEELQSEQEVNTEPETEPIPEIEQPTEIYSQINKEQKKEIENIPVEIVSNPQSENTSPTDDDVSQYIEDTGVSAIALYDYQAAANDEISFDPDDVITHIEKIDEGWWRGLSKNRYGLFPANYVQLQN